MVHNKITRVHFNVPHKDKKDVHHVIDNYDGVNLRLSFDRELNYIVATYCESVNKNIFSSNNVVLIKQPAKYLFYEVETKRFVLRTANKHNRYFVIAKHPDPDGESMVTEDEETDLIFSGLYDLFVKHNILPDPITGV